MKKALSKFILRMFGWKCVSTEGVDTPKCVVCVAPHTSNWDFIVGKLFYTSLGYTAGFLIKKEWFFFPFNLIFKSMGGVPVDRGKRTSVTEQVAQMFNEREWFQIAITPEGTRKRVKEWKKGFYFIAQKAQVPIMVAYFDYAKKEVGSKGLFYPTGDVEKDILEIRKMYNGVSGRHPENFVEV